jgi:hypothetical protein
VLVVVEVGDEVVDDAARRGVAAQRVLGLARDDLVTITLPRWLTSKMPTDSRTAVCSLTTPEGYSNGIDQPPNSASFAPSATCRSWSGDCRSSADGGVSSAMSANLHRLTPPASRRTGG